MVVWPVLLLYDDNISSITMISSMISISIGLLSPEEAHKNTTNLATFKT